MPPEEIPILQIFLCYSSTDKPIVRELYKRLKTDGFGPWLDEENVLPGQDWRETIEKAVKKSHVIIVCLSPSAVNEEGHIQKEIKIALDIADEKPEHTIFVIPLKIEECEIPERMRRWQYVNYFVGSREQSYQKLLKALQLRANDLSGIRSHSIVLPEMQVRKLEQVGKPSLHNLPPRRYTNLIGRDKEIENIISKLLSYDPKIPSVIAITGIGGIGKTALAYEIVERALQLKRFEGLIWESAKTEEMQGNRLVRYSVPTLLSFEDLLSSIAQQVGYSSSQHQDYNELYKNIRRILRSNAFLIVVDNIETIQNYQELAYKLNELLSSSASSQISRALLTSRERLTDYSYLYDCYIQGLTRLEAVKFLYQEADARPAPGILQAGDRLLERIFSVTHGMPLAMQLLVSQFIAGIPLDMELDLLEKATEEELYNYIYMRLWFKLSIAAQKMLVASVAFASSASFSMLQQISNTTDKEAVIAIKELVLMSLIDPTDHPLLVRRRYSIHPITRWFINSPLKELWQQQKKG